MLFAAFGLNLIPFLDISRESLLGPIYLADVVVALALLTWLADRLSGSDEAALPRTPVIGWPLIVFGVALVPGLVAGSERFGASFFGQPLRLVFYAAIVTTLTRLTAQEAYRGIVIVFYAGTVLQTLAAGYYLATGQSGTDAVGLSTGGDRVLALTAAMYLAGALVLALFNLQLDPRRWGLHVVMAGLALFGIVVTYGRTTYVAVAVLLVVLFALLGEMRRAVALSLPVVVPVVVIVVLLLPSMAPELIPTFTERINPSVETDSSYAWRQEAVEATLAATAEDRLLGGGFGATRTFSIETQGAHDRRRPAQQLRLPAFGRRHRRAGRVLPAPPGLFRRQRAKTLARSRHGASAGRFLARDRLRVPRQHADGPDPDRPGSRADVLGRARAAVARDAAAGRKSRLTVRICIVTVASYMRLGGMQDHTDDLSTCLVRLGHEVEVITGRRPDGLTIEERNGVTWHFLDVAPKLRPSRLRNPRWLGRSADAFDRLHAERRFDVVHSESTSALGLVAARRSSSSARRRQVPRQLPESCQSGGTPCRSRPTTESCCFVRPRCSGC